MLTNSPNNENMQDSVEGGGEQFMSPPIIPLSNGQVEGKVESSQKIFPAREHSSTILLYLKTYDCQIDVRYICLCSVILADISYFY